MSDFEDAPLILTLLMDDASQTKFDRLREAPFPPERNYLRAHLTLFHKLPAERKPEASADLREVCSDYEPFTLTATDRALPGTGRGLRAVFAGAFDPSERAGR